MRIVVTGSEGFIGPHLIRELRQVGHTVTGMDLKLGSVNQDAGSPRDLAAVLRATKPQVVVHLAAKVARRDAAEDDVLKVVRDNAGMTGIVAQACAEFGARLIYASSSEVYGDGGSNLCKEFSGPWSPPNTIYGLTKLWGESIAQLYAPDQLTILRFSMPYGPGLAAGKGGSGIINMLLQARYGMPIPVHKGAERSWCWIGDIARAARIAIENGSGPYNIGRDDEVETMVNVANIACELTGANKNLIRFVDPPEKLTVVKRLSTRRLNELGFKPEMPLRDGMERTLETWVDNLDMNGNYVDPKVLVKS